MGCPDAGPQSGHFFLAPLEAVSDAQVLANRVSFMASLLGSERLPLPLASPGRPWVQAALLCPWVAVMVDWVHPVQMACLSELLV